MAKGGKNRKQAGAAPGKTRYKLKRWEWAVIGGAVILAAWFGWQWQQSKGAEAAFLGAGSELGG